MSRLAYVISFVLHGLAGLALIFVAPGIASRRQSKLVSIVVQKAPKKMPKRVEVPPAPPTPLPPVLRPRRPLAKQLRRRIEMPPPVVPPTIEPPLAKEPPADSSPPEETPPNRTSTFGVTMESIVQGGSSISAPVGGTVKADPNRARGRRMALPGVPIGNGANPTGPEVTLPKLRRGYTASYPKPAREAGIEGKVILVLTINEQGQVAKARVVKGLGYGLDEVALDAARRFVFQPGARWGKPAVMEIRYAYTFVLED